MAKDKLGIKRLCLSCGKRFYDLHRNPIHCPSCGAKFDTNPSGRTRRQRATVEQNVTNPKAKPEKTNSNIDVKQSEDTPEFLGDEIEEDLEIEVEDNNVTEMLDGIEETKEENP